MKNIKHTSYIAGLVIAVLLVATPALSFAKNDKSNSNNEGTNTNQGCPTKAFGHLFALGWIKHNGATTVDATCHLPAGIAKKLGGNGSHGTTTPDVTAPVISGITFDTGMNQATVRWMTNEKSNSTVFLGTTTPVDTSTTNAMMITKSGLTRGHQIVIGNLSASTTYYVVIRSKDASGNIATSATLSFVTKAPSPDVTAPVISGVIAVVGTSTAHISWTTNELATSKIFYSTTTPVTTASMTAFVENTSLTLAHSLTLSGLATSTVYHILIQSADASNNTQTASEFSLTTGL